MKKFILMLAFLPSLVFAQWTQPQVNGLVKSLTDAVATISIPTPATITAQQLVTFGISQPANTPCVRCTIRLTQEQRVFLNPTLINTILEPADLYAVMQVCGPLFINGGVPLTKPTWLLELLETCSSAPILIASIQPSVTLAARTNPIAQSVATGFACACNTGIGSCDWTPPLIGGGYGASTPAPKNLTLPAGLWSGLACVLKNCVELYGSDSMPNACK